MTSFRGCAWCCAALVVACAAEGESLYLGGSGGGAFLATTSTGESGCLGIAREAYPVPAHLLLLVDRSGSFNDPPQKWAAMTYALKSFIGSPSAAGIRVGLNFFPWTADESYAPQWCQYAHYQDLDVPLAALPDNEAAMVAAIDTTTPSGMTPTFGALKGTLLSAMSYKDEHVGDGVAVVLTTDGEPNYCTAEENSIVSIAELAELALSYNGVRTYVVAVGDADVAALTPIALAGGTEQVFDVTSNTDALTAALSAIKLDAVDCEFAMPPAPEGETLDLGHVNVTYYAGGAGEGETIPHVEDGAACGTEPGWYYRDTTIVLCPATCDAVQADAAARVEIVFGCTTIVK